MACLCTALPTAPVNRGFQPDAQGAEAGLKLRLLVAQIPLLAPGLSGCTATASEAALWWFASLAMICVGGLAYALGALRARSGVDLETHRQPASMAGVEPGNRRGGGKADGDGAALRTRTQLDHSSQGADLMFRSAPVAALVAATSDAHGWQTDAAHRLLHWQAPKSSPSADSASECPLFKACAQTQALLDHLQSQRSFSALRLKLKPAFAGHSAWELHGQAQRDPAGRFLGFVGSAKGCDAEDSLRSAAALLLPALRANPAPTLVMWSQGAGWQLAELNPAAQSLWPTLKAGDKVQAPATPRATPPLSMIGAGPSDLGAMLSGWPLSEQTQAALEGLQAGQLPPTVDGWSLALTPTLAGGGKGAVLVRVSEASSSTTGPHQEADSFSFTLSHDLRAPIRVVEGFTRIVKEDYGAQLDRVGNDHLDRVLGAAARMNLMIDALLTLARLSTQPLARQPVNLSQLARYVADDLRRSAPEREAEFHIQDDLATTGDPTLMRLVLENLLGNAWKYSARSEQARISFGTVQTSAPAGSGAQVPVPMPVPASVQERIYVVRDNGAGFDMRYAERLFGLFQRLHSASDFAGHGVGLASVQRIIRRHGGQIWAEAEPGKGAAFFFTLDRAAGGG